MVLHDATVVFDLDGTLLDGDSTAAWMRARIRTSAWRTFLAVVALPCVLPLVLHAPSRRIGGSVLLWIATFGMNEMELRESFARFASQVGAGGRVTWRPGGLAALEKQVANREQVLIATAAPAWLAESLSETLPFRVPVVGSSLTRCLGGWVARHHCRHEAKCEAITRAGYGPQWAVAYSDSADDGPLLARATSAFLVNASDDTAKRLAKAGIKTERITW